MKQIVNVFKRFELNQYITVLLYGSILCATFNPLKSKIFLVIAGILWIKDITLKDLKVFLSSKAVIFLLLYYFYNLISFIWTAHTRFYYDWISNNFYFFLLPFILFATIATEKTIRIFTKLFLFTVFVNEVISYGIELHLWLHPKNGFPVFFMYHIPYSVIISLAILITYYELLHSKDNRLTKFLYITFLITMTGNLILSGGRTGQATLIASLVIYFLWALNKKHRKHIIATFALLVGFFVITYFIFPQFQQRTKDIYVDINQAILQQNYNTSVGTRLLSYLIAIKFIEHKNIVFGEGTGMTDSVKNELLHKYFPNKKLNAYHYTHLHEYYLNTFVETGIVGLFLFFGFIYFLAKTDTHNNEMRNIKIMLIAVILISDMFDRIMLVRTTMLAFSLFAGLIIASIKIKLQGNKI